MTAAAPYLAKNFDNESYFRVSVFLFGTRLSVCQAHAQSWKVHWTKVTDLVEKRRVYLEKGQAFVPMSQQISLVLAEFSSRLDRALDVSSHFWKPSVLKSND